MNTQSAQPAPSLDGATPDAEHGHWVRRTPERLRPYLRLARFDRPVGTWLLWIPCLWGLALGRVNGHGEIGLLFFYAALTAIGAFAMRGAGCAYNDIVDKDIDAKVARTASRPLPSGQLSAKAAWGFLVLLCLIGFLVLIQFNPFAIGVGIASLFLVAIYPFMKRVTYWPQAWLGFTFNWGVLVGYAAVAGGISWGAGALYLAGVFWTLGYDTIYAHQDKEDDALIGVKSTALAFGAQTKQWLALFYFATIAFFAIGGAMSGASPVYFISLIPGAAHLARQVHVANIDNGEACLKVFKSNRDAGLLLALAPICEAAAASLL